MSISPLALTAKKTIEAAWLNGPSYDLAAQAAFALESAQLLQSPETAAELEKLRAERAEVVAEVQRFGIYGSAVPVTKALVKRADELVNETAALRARVAELEAERQATVTKRTVEVSADKLTRMLAPTQALREDPHDSPLHHTYRLGRDLPPLDGTP